MYKDKDFDLMETEQRFGATRLPWFCHEMVDRDLAHDAMEESIRNEIQIDVDTALQEYYTYRESLEPVEVEEQPEWVDFINWMEKVV